MAYPTFRFRPNNKFNTTLDGAITAVTDPIPVVDNSDAEDGPGYIVIENDIRKYDTKGSNQFSGITTGISGTEPVGHASGLAVSHPVAADIFEKIWDGIEYLKSIANDIVTAKGDLVAGTGNGTVDNLAVGTNGFVLKALSSEATGLVWANAATAAETLTNKRTQKRVYETTSLATLTPEIDTYDIFNLTAQAEAINIANHSTSTPVNGEMIMIDILPDATPRAITYGTNYVEGHGVELPSTTVASKRLTMLFTWIGATSKYSIVWAGQEA